MFVELVKGSVCWTDRIMEDEVMKLQFAFGNPRRKKARKKVGKVKKKLLNVVKRPKIKSLLKLDVKRWQKWQSVERLKAGEIRASF